MCKVGIAIVPIFWMRRLWLREEDSLLMVKSLSQGRSQDSNPRIHDLNARLLASMGAQSQEEGGSPWVWPDHISHALVRPGWGGPWDDISGPRPICKDLESKWGDWWLNYHGNTRWSGMLYRGGDGAILKAELEFAGGGKGISGRGNGLNKGLEVEKHVLFVLDDWELRRMNCVKCNSFWCSTSKYINVHLWK